MTLSHFYMAADKNAIKPSKQQIKKVSDTLMRLLDMVQLPLIGSDF